MPAAPTSPGASPKLITPASDTQPRVLRARRHRPLLPIEQQHQDATFRSERLPAELELDAIDAETASMQVTGWTAHG